MGDVMLRRYGGKRFKINYVTGSGAINDAMYARSFTVKKGTTNLPLDVTHPQFEHMDVEFLGWTEDPKVSTIVSSKPQKPTYYTAVPPGTDHDVTLYAVWRQDKMQYSGTAYGVDDVTVGKFPQQFGTNRSTNPRIASVNCGSGIRGSSASTAWDSFANTVSWNNGMNSVGPAGSGTAYAQLNLKNMGDGFKPTSGSFYQNGMDHCVANNWTFTCDAGTICTSDATKSWHTKSSGISGKFKSYLKVTETGKNGEGQLVECYVSGTIYQIETDIDVPWQDHSDPPADSTWRPGYPIDRTVGRYFHYDTPATPWSAWYVETMTW